MSADQRQPFDVLQRMQQQAAAAGYVLPELKQTEERWHGLAFAVGPQRLTAELTAFTDIVDCGAITPVPRTRAWVRGITNVRGTLYSVADLAQFLGYPRVNTDTEGKLLVINDGELGCALLVNSVLGMRRFDHENEYQDAAVMDRSVQPFVSHAYLQDEQLWGVLDNDKLKASDKFRDVEVEN
ncbi:MAG: chemotaxis protein CheW [Gammaproteobacteria bacterium]|nr:chemotaxis protein CheW [Gammaproteobacteria bacterium]